LMPSCTTKVPVQVISQVIHSVLLVIMFIAQDQVPRQAGGPCRVVHVLETEWQPKVP